MPCRNPALPTGAAHAAARRAVALAVLVLLVSLPAAGESRERDRYLRLVGAWAADPRGEVADELAALEREGGRRIAEAEERFAVRLGKAAPDALLGLALLHHHTLFDHLEKGYPAVAGGAVERLEKMLDRYRSRSADPEARSRAARVWTAVAFLFGTRVEVSLGWVRRAFLEALEVDPRSPAALHGLAVVEERLGEHSRALTRLDRLLDLEPENAEARLRRALVRARIGRDKAASTELAALARGPAPDWVRVLAYQELARLEQAAGRAERAVAVLEEGAVAYPGNERLAIQLAYALRPSWPESTARLEPLLDGWSREAGPTPRLRYDLGPVDDAAALDEALAGDLEAGVAALREGLARLVASSAEAGPEDAR